MTTETTLYERIGGADGVRRLTRRFYDLMDTLPEAKAVRAIHPGDLAGSEEKLYEYLTGWLGGPPLFVEKRGPPMLRRRHLHVGIGTDEIAGWLICFRRAWGETVNDPELDRMVLPQVEHLAHHMRNMAD